MIDRLVERCDALKICIFLKWDSLSITNWGMLERVLQLLKPFASYTQLLTGSTYSTLPSGLPSVLELEQHLEDVNIFLQLFDFLSLTVISITLNSIDDETSRPSCC